MSAPAPALVTLRRPAAPAPWVTGAVATPIGPVPRVATAWTRRDRVEHLRCRLGAFRNRYAVPPGLYAVGSPDAQAEVLVTANYKLSFDHLRRALAGLDAWVLVLDTRGVNVWCAAGKGTFGTAELAQRIEAVGLDRVVAHRRVILPQLGAPGVAAHEVQRATRFRVHYGPVRASDLPAYLRAGREATPELRRVRFPIADRAVLIPIELVPASKALAAYAAAALVAGAIGPGGPTLARLAAVGLPLAGLGAAAVLAGAVLTPLLLPFVPGRAFAVKGALVGAAVTAAYVAAVPALRGGPLAAFAWAFAPAASSYLAMNFTGASTYTSLSGVRKELRRAIPVHAAAAAVALASLAVHHVALWRAS